MTRTLDRSCEVTLMSCAGTCYTAGKDLSSLGQVTADAVYILVVDILRPFLPLLGLSAILGSPFVRII